MNRMLYRSAFTLLELLIVLAILAILLPLALNWVGRYTAVQQVRQAQQEFVQILNRARSQARRTSTDWSVEIQADKKTIKLKQGVTDVDTLVLPSGAQISGSTPTTSSIVFTAPFGRKDAVDVGFSLQPTWAIVTAKVNIIGVIGKVVAVDALN